MTMSEQVTSALIGARHRGQGAAVPTTDSNVRLDLEILGLIGPDGGLTRKGTIARERAIRAAEDAAF